ncbi:hypothetical protein NPIL_344061 [Nephila pilipes]|uniref:Uncharacterized protein n=1 Tax=Nephila pilipes TaxID=299642 RepID=A0A8X6TYZ5_NEPPI|nr:hypothetical protein NPIL_344061 [Nephila pilipes]
MPCRMRSADCGWSLDSLEPRLSRPLEPHEAIYFGCEANIWNLVPLVLLSPWPFLLLLLKCRFFLLCFAVPSLMFFSMTWTCLCFILLVLWTFRTTDFHLGRFSS